MPFLFLQTPLPKLLLSQLLCTSRSEWYGCRQKHGCRLQQRVPLGPQGANYDIWNSFIFLTFLKTCFVSSDSSTSSSQSRGTCERIVKIAVFLFHFLEALTVWGRLLGYTPLLDTFHGCAGARAGCRNVISWA